LFAASLYKIWEKLGADALKEKLKLEILNMAGALD